MIYNYPHTSMQDMNLDWLIKIAKESKDILDSVHSDIEKYFTDWINANYAKLMLNAFYNGEQKEIIFTTAMKSLDIHSYDSKNQTMNINQLI